MDALINLVTAGALLWSRGFCVYIPRLSGSAPGLRCHSLGPTTRPPCSLNSPQLASTRLDSHLTLAQLTVPQLADSHTRNLVTSQPRTRRFVRTEQCSCFRQIVLHSPEVRLADSVASLEVRPSLSLVLIPPPHRTHRGPTPFTFFSLATSSL